VNSVDVYILLDVIIGQVFERSNIDGASVEEQHRNIDIFDCVSNTLVILNGVVLAEVKSHGTGLDFGKLGLEFIKFLFDLAESSADDADVEALLGHLSANLEADTIRATCDEGVRILTCISLVVVVWLTKVVADESAGHSGRSTVNLVSSNSSAQSNSS